MQSHQRSRALPTVATAVSHEAVAAPSEIRGCHPYQTSAGGALIGGVRSSARTDAGTETTKPATAKY